MSDRHEPTPSPIPHDADPVAQLVRLAGARPPVPPERAARVEALVRASWQSGVASRRRSRWIGWSTGLAAAAALALLVGITWRYVMQPPVPPAQAATLERALGTVTVTGPGGVTTPLVAGAGVFVGSQIATAGDGRAALRLPGAAGALGPSLRLDVDSRATFLATDRLRLDAGAVYVDSQGRGDVLVETPWGLVTERGTQFEVRVGAGGVRVRVREGAVELASKGAGPSRAWEARAGAELLLAGDGRLSRATVRPDGEAWTWVQQIAPSFQLEGRPLGELLAWVGRESGWHVVFADPGRGASASSVTLHGSIEGLSPEQALNAVLPTCGLAGRRDGDSVVVFASSR
jgi:ferric-dicitrate binding protein FerR (iron transport regulator)